MSKTFDEVAHSLFPSILVASPDLKPERGCQAQWLRYTQSGRVWLEMQVQQMLGRWVKISRAVAQERRVYICSVAPYSKNC